jgi:hypothetical protein
MSLRKDLRLILEQSALTQEEVRAFETGLMLLTDEEQEQFAEIIKEDSELIYPLYINFKAKIHAVRGTKEEWEEAIETEIVQLEDFMSKRKFGDEIR